MKSCNHHHRVLYGTVANRKPCVWRPLPNPYARQLPQPSKSDPLARRYLPSDPVKAGSSPQNHSRKEDTCAVPISQNLNCSTVEPSGPLSLTLSASRPAYLPHRCYFRTPTPSSRIQSPASLSLRCKNEKAPKRATKCRQAGRHACMHKVNHVLISPGSRPPPPP